MAGNKETALQNLEKRKSKGGRPKGSKATHTLEAEESRKILIAKALSRIGPIADALIEKATKGDIQATRELFDRIWGRAAQAIDVTSQGKSIAPTEASKKMVEKALLDYLNGRKDDKSNS